MSAGAVVAAAVVVAAATETDVETSVAPILTVTMFEPVTPGTMNEVVRPPSESEVTTPLRTSAPPIVRTDRPERGANPAAVTSTTSPTLASLTDSVTVGLGTFIVCATELLLYVAWSAAVKVTVTAPTPTVLGMSMVVSIAPAVSAVTTLVARVVEAEASVSVTALLGTQPAPVIGTD